MGVTDRVANELRTAATAARQGTMSSAMTHAWLFTGPPGSGRSIAALAFAAALECVGPVVGCGTCVQCTKVLRNAHADVIHIVPRELSIGVESMRRDVVEPAAMMPTVGKWRVVILDDADRLTEASANALLKTVEEPPAHTVIMLCAPSTDPEEVIPTLVSRSRHVYVALPTRAEVSAILQREGISERIADLAAAATGNHIGRARHLATNTEAQQRRAEILYLPELISQGDVAFQAVTDLIKRAKEFALHTLAVENEQEMEKLRMSLGMGAKGKGAQKALSGSASQVKELEKLQKKRETRAVRDVLDMQLVDLMGLYRDALMLATGTDLALMHPDMDKITEKLRHNDADALLACIEAIQLCRDALTKNVRPETAMDAMVGRIRKAIKPQ